MIVRETEEDYTVYGVQAEQKGDQYVLKWKFRQADGFVIALSRFGKMDRSLSSGTATPPTTKWREGTSSSSKPARTICTGSPMWLSN